MKHTSDPVAAAVAAVRKALERVGGYGPYSPDERLRPLAAAVGASRTLTSMSLQSSDFACVPGMYLRLFEELQAKQPKRCASELVGRRTALVEGWIAEDGTAARPPWEEYARRLKREHPELYPDGKPVKKVAGCLRERHRPKRRNR